MCGAATEKASSWSGIRQQYQNGKICLVYSVLVYNTKIIIRILTSSTTVLSPSTPATCPKPSGSRLSSRKNNACSYDIPSCRTLYRQMSFFPRTIPDWNGLPPETVTAESPDCFKPTSTRSCTPTESPPTLTNTTTTQIFATSSVATEPSTK